MQIMVIRFREVYSQTWKFIVGADLISALEPNIGIIFRAEMDSALNNYEINLPCMQMNKICISIF